MNREIGSLQELAYLLDWTAVLFLLLTLVLLYLGKLANQVLVDYDLDHELTTADNKAVAVSFSGFIFALALILHGVFSNPSPSGHLREDLLSTIIWGTVGCVFLLIAQIMNDRFILPQFSNQKELINDRNLGVGVVQAGGYLATALIIRGMVSGEDIEGLGRELLIATLWFLGSQLLLLMYAAVYEKWTSFNLHSELEKGNAAVGISFAGSLVAFGILISFYLECFVSIIGFIIWVVLATLLLKLIRIIVDRILFSKVILDKELSEDRHLGVALIDAAVSIIAALILTGALF